MNTIKIWNGRIDVICVRDGDGISTWTPSAEAQAEIQAAADPEGTALRMCESDPMRGEWSN